METNQILTKTAEAVLQEPVKLTVDVIAKTRWQKLLRRFRLHPKSKTFHVHPLTLGTLVRISKLLLSIDSKTIENLMAQKNILDNNYALMEKHSEALARVVALAVTNTKEEPSEKLVNFFLHHLTAKELNVVLGIVLKQMNINDFMISIVSIRSIQVMETSPADQKS